MGTRIAGGIKPEEFDVFHEMIAIDEVARCGSGGVLWALFAGLSIGLPPLLYFASPALQDKVLSFPLLSSASSSPPSLNRYLLQWNGMLTLPSRNVYNRSSLREERTRS